MRRTAQPAAAQIFDAAQYPPLLSKTQLAQKGDDVEEKVEWKLEVKHVDEVRDPMRGTWSQKDSSFGGAAGIKKEKDAFSDYPFTVNYTIQTTMQMLPDGSMAEQKQVQSTKIEMKSPHLRAVGKEVIGDIQGISWSAKPLKVEPNILLALFPDLEARLTSLKAKDTPTEEESTTIAHLELLLKHLQEEYAPVFADIAYLLEHQEMRFELLWAILVPRTIFYLPCSLSGEPRAARLKRADLITPSNQPPYWQLQFEYVEWFSKKAELADDPHHFGLADLPAMKISSFKGTIKIRRLPTYPLVFHPNVAELKETLLARGKKWCALQGVHHRQYHGIAFNQGQPARPGLGIFGGQGGLGKNHTTGRIMVDRKTYTEFVPNNRLPDVVRDLTGTDIDPHLEALPVEDEAPRDLTENELLMASPLVYGFSLASKKWLIFKVKDVHTFEWNDHVFDELVLPPAQKNLVRSLVIAHKSDDTGFDDFIAGKGRGLVINIFGNPGVGKSLTAEATSEHLRKPLYVVGGGDLGTKADILDSNLSMIFNVSTKWGAVVLIDEADVFLEQRSLHDLERNAMVAVFLRQLEYFRGILFLTTNRVRSFDVAFQSRIHVSLHYEDLAESAKEKIWISFMRKARTDPKTLASTTAGFSADQLATLRVKNVNGRQIKNAVRTASAIASSAGEEMSYAHLIQVLDIMDQFDFKDVDRKTPPPWFQFRRRLEEPLYNYDFVDWLSLSDEDL